jgi:hypothetical protein
MKLEKVRSHFLPTIGLLSLLWILPAAHASQGGSSGGGGAACVGPDGQLSTLYYCGAYQEPMPTTPVQPAPPLSIDGPSEQPADLAALEKYISDFPYLTQIQKAEITNAMYPSFTRKYFSTVVPPDLTAPIVDRIKAEFQRATGLDPSHLTLYAVTDTNAHMDNYSSPIQVTYLLPAYFALQTQEQRMVALFHENLWVLNPNADYSTIIGREMAFEAIMAQPNNTERLSDFVQRMEGDVITHGTMTLTLRQDIESGALAGFVNSNNEFSNLQLFGKDAISCLNSSAAQSDENSLQICATSYEDYLDDLRRTYPKSNFLALMDDQAKHLFESINGNVWSQYNFPSSALYNLISFANGDEGNRVSAQFFSISNNFPGEWNAYAAGLPHIFWSLADKDKNGIVSKFSQQTGPALTTDQVMIHVDTSAQGAVNGPLSTASTSFPSSAEGGTHLYTFDLQARTLGTMIEQIGGSISLASLFGQNTLDCIVKESTASDDSAERLKLLQTNCFPLLKTQLQSLSDLYPQSQIIRFLSHELTPSMDARGFGIVELTLRSCTFLGLGCSTTQTARIDDWVRNTKNDLKLQDIYVSLDQTKGILFESDTSIDNSNSNSGNVFSIPLYLGTAGQSSSASQQ